MLDQLSQIIRQFGQSAVVENNEVPNEHNEGVMDEAQNAIFSGLQNMMANGQMNQLTELLNSNGNVDPSNPAIEGITNNFLGGITEKFGISKETGMKIAMALIPMVIAQFTKKAGDTNDQSLDIGGILKSLTGGGGLGNIGDILSKFGK